MKTSGSTSHPTLRSGLVLCAALAALMALGGPLAAQIDMASSSYRSECTIVLPAIDTVTSSSYSSLVAVGAAVLGTTASASYSTTIDVLCDHGAGTPPCGGVTLCGDCNGDGRVDILDALTAARHAAGMIVLVGIAYDSCNVDNDVDVDILDALRLAQAAAGIPIVLMCC